ncbi:MAG TPA: hypothetical protein PLP33_24545 [Leptospiraceae bacterium]|nr:hypothetical protein [Leptospiraceae bacterium]
MCVVAEHGNSGRIGLVPEIYYDWYESTQGKNGGYMPALILGHDLVDHGSKESGSLENELKAIGSLMWRTDMFCNQLGFYIPPQERVKAILIEIINDAHELNNYSFPDVSVPPKVCRFDKDEIEEISNVFNQAWNNFVEYFLKSFDTWNESEEKEEKDYFLQWCEDSKKNVLNWIIYGFWYASRKRYAGHDSYHIQRLCRLIDEETEKVTNGLNEEDLGKKFMFSYSVRYCEVKVGEIAPEI